MQTLDLECGERYKFNLIDKDQNQISMNGQVVSVNKRCDGEEIVFVDENQHFYHCVFGLNIAPHKLKIVDATQL